MEFSILGPLKLSNDGRTGTPTAPKPRSVLGLLLLSADQTVQVSALIRDLWGTSPPVSAVTTLQTYILQIRKCLGELVGIAGRGGGSAPAHHRAGGVSAANRLGGVRPRAFDLLAAAGRDALAVGENSQAVSLLSRACGLWRGPALADVRAGAVTEAQLMALEQVRLNTIEQYVDARMRLGHHQDVLLELTLLVAEHGPNENFCAQLMLALHRSGRRRDALSVFHQLRTSMIEELGLEPSKRLHLLQQAILSDDPALEVTPRSDGLIQLLEHFAPQRARVR